jgi:hypothetical protein
MSNGRIAGGPDAVLAVWTDSAWVTARNLPTEPELFEIAFEP